MTSDQASLIDLNKVMNFLKSDLAIEMKQAVKIEKELPFTTLLDAKSVYPDLDEFQMDILIQGVVDLLVIFKDKAVLIDFKSDQIKDDEISINRLKKQYQTQLNIYKKALENRFIDVEIKPILYLFEVNKLIEM